MRIPLYQIDAFVTERPFTGNPAAVCPLEAWLPDDLMQAIAAENNLAETAFFVPEGDGYRLRWFTPTVEVDLCGHATLAAAHVLWASERVTGPVRFHTRSGVLTCTAAGKLIEMDFPAEPAAPAGDLGELALLFGATPTFLGRNRMDVLVALPAATDVRAFKPDMSQLAKIQARGVIVTAPGDEPGIDFVSRFFAPQSGVPEDPVTGSAHCGLGPYWRGILGKDSLVGYQASARGGTVRVRCAGNRVVLGGGAVMILEGVLRV
jgi:PhzF family phenazine biosynthesis protein